jgi:hypothetical protein
LDVIEFKEKITNLLGSNVKFDGHINKVVLSLDSNRFLSIYRWIEECINDKHRCIPCMNKRNIIAFIYKSNDNKLRVILTKEINGYYIEILLDKHKYYDNKRKSLGII